MLLLLAVAGVRVIEYTPWRRASEDGKTLLEMLRIRADVSDLLEAVQTRGPYVPAAVQLLAVMPLMGTRRLPLCC